MRIRDFQKQEEVHVKNLVIKILKENGWKPSPQYDPDFYDLFNYYKQGNSRFFILEDYEKIIGCIGIEDKGVEAELRKFFLEKAYRQKGLGRMLLDHALTYCKNKHFQSVHILTDAQLIPAISLYQKKGFTIIKKTEKGDVELKLVLLIK